MTDQTQRKPSALRNAFIHPTERRLRMFWRLVAFGVLFFLSLLCVATVTLPLIMLADPSANITNLPLIYNSIITVLSITGTVFLVRRFIDRKSIKSLGLRLERQTVLDLLVGIGITLLQFLLIFGISLLAGWTQFEGFAWESSAPLSVLGTVLLGLLNYLIVGWTEELMSRGYLLQNLEEGTNLFWGLVLSSAIFSVAHFFNPNRTWVALLGLLLAGLFLASAYIRTRQLWLAIGLHIGWNFFEGPIFGYPVSGLQQTGLIQQQTAGPEMFTGGPFGPEAGLIVIPGILLGTLLVWLYTRGRDTSQTPKNTPLLHKRNDENKPIT